MAIHKKKIHKILTITLSNIGDVILTFPVIDILKEDFPQAEFSIVTGPKAKPLFDGNEGIKKVYVYNKKQPVAQTIQWIKEMRKERFDLVVDLRNSFTPFLIAPRYMTSPFMKRLKNTHMRNQHLNRLRSVYPYEKEALKKYALRFSDDDKQQVTNIMKNEIGQTDNMVVICPGAADQRKQWTAEGFAAVADHLTDRHHVTVVFIGDMNDRKIAQHISKLMTNKAVNLSGKLTLTQVGFLLSHAKLAIVNDSAPMHLASYMNIPVLALFGPTEPKRYGPWSAQSYFIRKNRGCEACQNPDSALSHSCMSVIIPSDILDVLQFTDHGVVFTV